MSKFKKGDRVRVRPGAVTGVSLDGWPQEWKTGFSYPWSDGIYGVNDAWLELITSNSKENKPMGRRTFRLLKETPDYKIGALFQEACDDGDQEYVIITRHLLKFQEANHSNTPSFERVEIETQPDWFEEVEQIWVVKNAPKKRGRPVGSKTKKAAPTTKAKIAASWTPERRKAQARRMKAYHASKRGQ